jgi:hypothetical protein
MMIILRPYTLTLLIMVPLRKGLLIPPLQVLAVVPLTPTADHNKAGRMLETGESDGMIVCTVPNGLQAAQYSKALMKIAAPVV